MELSHILGMGSEEQVAHQAQRLIAEYGFKTLKLKASLDSKQDTAIVKAVREAVRAGTMHGNNGVRIINLLADIRPERA